MIKFGTGGWRAVIADDFTKTNLRLLTAGLCRLMEKEGRAGAELCVGYDRRFLSKESAHWIAEVLAGFGFRTLMVNRSSPTPLIMYIVKTRGLPYGMMVTASHNPAVKSTSSRSSRNTTESQRIAPVTLEKSSRSSTSRAPAGSRISHSPVERRKFCRKDSKNCARTPRLSRSRTIRNTTVYSAVSDAPIVTTGIEQSRKMKLSSIRSPSVLMKRMNLESGENSFMSVAPPLAQNP